MFSWQVSEMSKVERLNRMNFLLRGLAFKYHFVKGPPSKLANDSIDRSVSWIHWNCKWLPLLGLAFVSENECLKMMHVKRDWTFWLFLQPTHYPTPPKTDNLHSPNSILPTSRIPFHQPRSP